MENDEEVKITSDNGHRLQWATGLFYKKEGGKLILEKKRFAWLAIPLVVVTTIAVFLKDTPREAAQASQIESPGISLAPADFEIETYEKKRVEKKSGRLQKLPQVTPLKVVSRPGINDIPPGTEAKAELLSGATNGPVKARLIEDVEFNGEIFFEAGATLIGNGVSTEERLIIYFSQLVTKEGNTVTISAQAHDSKDKVIGLTGSKVGRVTKKVLAAAGLGAAGALQTLQKQESVGGTAVPKPDLNNAFLNGASVAALGLAEHELEQMQEKQAIIEVASGKKFYLIFGGE